ncbi:CPBP family intramembrane metalloprotease [Halorussus limi]|uniref:CPBP family intramembrane metalloprotease n=1 Tax=Halorussus limi TaxID=2938695 RepID=A0A8U0HPP2_9EURY|nr:CPBP family intramembrane glutamic endopeptidase [Halorussus limi]UPV72831.1 CPBP family intramembrane metalloprotease [Halorussus limi]
MGLTVVAVVVNGIFTLPALFWLTGIERTLGVTVLGEVAFAVVGAGFLTLTGRGLDFLDLSVPDSRTLAKYVLGATAALFALRSAVVGVASLAGVPLAPPSILQSSVDTQSLLLAMIPLSVLVIGPSEELLFRGVVQRYLAGAFSVRGAVFGAGVLFAAIHLPTLVVVPSALGIAVTLFVILLVGLAFGWLYASTDSLPVAMAVHGLYNASIFASAYLLIEFDVIAAGVSW